MKFHSRRTALARIIAVAGRYANVIEKNNIKMHMPRSSMDPELKQNYYAVFITDEDLNCSICATKIEENKTYYLPACGHLFCNPCMNNEKEESLRCGNCAKKLSTAEPVEVLMRNLIIET